MVAMQVHCEEKLRADFKQRCKTARVSMNKAINALMAAVVAGDVKVNGAAVVTERK